MTGSRLVKTAFPIIVSALAFLSACQSDEYQETFHYPQGDQDFSQAEVDTEIEAEIETELETEIENECIPDEHRCADEKTVERCGNDGQWHFYKQCADNTYCSEGACYTDSDVSCTPGEKRCDATNTAVERCNRDGNGWLTHVECTFAEVCEDIACVPVSGEECLVSGVCTNPDEYCLPNHPGGDNGYCTIYCDWPDVHCRCGWYCRYGQCEPIPNYCRSDEHCKTNFFCERFPGREDGNCVKYCFAEGEYCPYGSTCIEDATDENFGRCVSLDFPQYGCVEDSECPDGYYCDRQPDQSRGMCRGNCNENHPCPDDLTCCENGVCGVGDCKNDCGGLCHTGYVCDEVYNICALNCPQCPAGECCNAESAPDCYPCHPPCINPPVCGIIGMCCPGYNCVAVVYGVYGFCM